MDRYCRVCARDDLTPEEMVSLFCERKGEVIANMIIDCADVMVSHDDNLPNSVCPDCLTRLVDAFTLRKLIRDSEAGLKAIALQLKAEKAGETLIDPLQLLPLDDVMKDQSLINASTGAANRSTNYPTEEQIDSIVTFETYKVIKLRGVRCCGCAEILPSKQDLIRHSRQEHSHRAGTIARDQVVFQCPTCFEHFPNRMKLLNHTKNYESNEIYHCSVCDILFDIKYRLLQHQNLSKVHHTAPVAGSSSEHQGNDISTVVKERRRNQSRKRAAKELSYPDAEFILCIDETAEYQIIHLGGERCCGCGMVFHDYQDLIDHCGEVHPRMDDECTTYECILCFERFEQVQSYNRHRTARVQKEIYYCKFCDVVIDIKFRFEQHLKTSVAHQAAVEKAGIKPSFPAEERPLSELRVLERNIETLEIDGIRCCGCEFVCNTREELEDHSEERHGFERNALDSTDEFECDICFKRFAKLGALTCHRNLALQKTVYKCKHCDLQSEIKYRILQHIAGSAHQTEDQPEPVASEPEPKVHYCCFVKCPVTFEDPNDLLDHVEEQHAPKRRENARERESDAFICYVCHKSFKNERSLQSHQFPKKIENPHVCGTCGTSFLYLSALTNHKKMHTGVKEYKCDVCDKEFYDERALKIHQVCHKEERPFVCDICSKSFLRKGNLRVHKRCHSDNIWECPHCSSKFKTKQSLTLHIRSHTGEKPFKCRYCTNRYSHSTDRNRHEMAAHTKVRPHKCTDCDMTFIRKRQLTLHARTHTGERPYTCHICDRTFVQSTYLKKHLATHEKHGTNIKETEYLIELLPEEHDKDFEVVEMLEDDPTMDGTNSEDDRMSEEADDGE